MRTCKLKLARLAHSAFGEINIAKNNCARYFKFSAVPVTVCSYVNRGQRRGIPGEYHATQAQTNEMARNEAAFAQTEYNWQFESSDRAFRGVPRFRRFINSNCTSSMGEIPIRCQLKRPYFTSQDISPRRYFKRESNTICTDWA